MSVQPQTADELLLLIERSGLVPLEQIKQKLGGQSPGDEALPFAKRLIKAGLLTTFQADNLLQGKSRGFFLGKYRILKRLGGGATAGVFLCEHQIMKSRVAIKVLDAQLLRDDEHMLQRFRREARAAAALDHPNIVRTIDLDEDNGRHFLVMEFVEGVTLNDWLEKHPQPVIAEVVQMIQQAAVGLQHIHESNLIHRDLKPTNLLIDGEGTVKILDLGLARFTDDRHDDLTQMQGHNIMGTVDFMSPEQADGNREIDIRADIYSLGATLYYLLSGGTAPFPDCSVGVKMMAIQFQEPRRLTEFRAEVDPNLEQIIGRMMAKQPEQRLQTPEEAVLALQAWLDRVPGTVEPASSQSFRKQDLEDSEPIPMAVMVGPALPVSPTTRTRRRTLLWLLRAAGLLILVGALIALKPWSNGTRAAAQTNDAKNTR